MNRSKLSPATSLGFFALALVMSAVFPRYGLAQVNPLSEEHILSLSKHSSVVRTANSQAQGTSTVSFLHDVCIRGASFRLVGPSGNIITLLSLDPAPPFTSTGLEGRTGDLFIAKAGNGYIPNGFGFSDVTKEVFFPSSVCHFVRAGTPIYIYTFDDVGGAGGAFDHVTILYYTKPKNG